MTNINNNEKKELLSLFPSELEELVLSIGEPKFRAKQIFTQLHRGLTVREMTNVGKRVADKLDEVSYCHFPEVAKKLTSAIDGTVKYLFSLRDGNCIESVVMRYKHGNTICISSQVGCRMGCRFCASTIGGKVRDLTAGELLGQIIAAEKDTGERISNIVMMGIGEPLDNYDNVIRFLRLVGEPDGLNIGYRHISLSTCGVVPKINELAKLDLPITLSISLHASDDTTRSEIMPINRKWNIAALLAACKSYYEKTGRRISFEYAMIRDVNDSKETAELLAQKLNGIAAHVNLIPLNNIEESPLKPSTRQAVAAFQKTLEDAGIPATVRRSLGGDIDASCGQLRRKYTKGQ